MDKYIDADKLPNIYTVNHQELVLALELEETYAADVAPVQRDAWIDVGDGCVWECDKCGFTIEGYLYTDTDLPNFCPNCGNDKRQWLTDMLDFETQRAKEIWNELEQNR